MRGGRSLLRGAGARLESSAEEFNKNKRLLGTSFFKCCTMLLIFPGAIYLMREMLSSLRFAQGELIYRESPRIEF